MTPVSVLPMKPLDERIAGWSSIAELIYRYIVPTVEVAGAAPFVKLSSDIGQPVGRLPAAAVRVLYPPLTQRAIVIGFVLQGYGEMLVNDCIVRLQAQHGIVVPPSVSYAPHVTRNDIVPFSEWLWIAAYPHGVMANRCQVTMKEHRSSQIFFVADPTLSELLHRWYHQPENRRSKWILLAFFSLLADAAPLPANMLTDLDGPRTMPTPVQKALFWFYRHYYVAFDLKAVADYCCVSPHHLCRLFRRHLRTTPLGYLRQLRLEIAKHFLQETQLSVAQIAALVGYRDLRLFRRHFSRYLHAPPHRFRQ